MSDSAPSGEPRTPSQHVVYAAAARVLAAHLHSLDRADPAGESQQLQRALLSALPEALATDARTTAESIASQLGALAQRRGVPLPTLIARAQHTHTHTMDAIISPMTTTDHAGLVALLHIDHILRDLCNAVLAGYQDAALALLTAQALTDGLTGVANRRAFDTRLRNEIARAARFGHGVALVLLDIDGLKQMNDTRGHVHGDLLVCTVATIVREQARGIDLVARIGGDEFAVIVPEADHAGADALVHRLARTVDTPQVNNRAVRFSVGVAVYPDDGTTPTALIHHADQAMYAAKRGITVDGGTVDVLG